MELLEWQNSARGEVAGVELTPAGPVARIDGEPLLLREPKISELRQIDVLFWKTTDAEREAIGEFAVAPVGLGPVEANRFAMDQRQRINGFRSKGGFGPVWALTIRLLNGKEIADDDMPAWSTTGDVLFELITAWWNTPLARGPQSPLE